MTSLKYKTRGNANPQGKPRVYFCCHPKDFTQYFDAVSDDILAKQNCAIWYLEDSATEHDTDFLNDIKQMQLFVMPVTTNLLCTENFALDVEFQFATQNHIPVLPLMQESGLEELFNKKCGDLQFLDKYNTDATAISYDEKLQKYLESVLIGDVLAEKIRAAFDAYVFLSYRKKDRRYAQELMRLIHKNEFCRDIAIWYDEFLTPGENFNDSIKDALQKSGLFVLTVTPNLVNETNYIMTTEYPMAQQTGKPILPAELVPTDRNQLAEKYEGIPQPADAHNEAALSAALLESIKKIAIKDNDSSPEHNFFIGLAYLGGIDVEINSDRALSLISSAAEAGLTEAMKKLAEMYLDGISVKKDLELSVHWQQRLTQKLKELYDVSHSKQTAIALLNCLYTLGETLENMQKYTEVLDVYQQCMDICERGINQDNDSIDFLREQSFSSCKLGYIQKLLGNYSQALNAHILAYEKAKLVANKTQSRRDLLHLSRCHINLGEFSEEQSNFSDADKAYHDALEALFKANETETEFGLRQTHSTYLKLGDINKQQQKYTEALAFYEKALAIAERLAAEYESVVNKLNLSITYNKIGHILKRTADLCDATDQYLKAYEIVIALYDEAQTFDVQRQMMICCSHLAGINKQRENFELAEELYLDALNICKTLADTAATLETYRDLRVSCDNLATFYEEQSNLKKALQLRFFELDAGKKAADTTNAYKDLLQLSTCYNNLAHLLCQLGKTAEALSQYENAYKIREILSAQFENPTILSALDYNCGCMAEAYLAMGDLNSARMYYQKSVDICKKLTDKEDSVSNLDGLGTAYVNLASVESGESQRSLLEQASSIYEKLCATTLQNQRFKDDLAAIRNGIADIDKKNNKRSGFFKKLFQKQ